MSKDISRRNFVVGSAVAAAAAGLAACASSTTTSTGSDAGSAADATETTAAASSDVFTAPDASAYPIDADGDDVEPLWTSSTSRKDKFTLYTNPEGGRDVSVMDTAKMIQVDGLAFRDMNGDGKLELWEDWRQPNADRAKALAETLSAEEIIPLMWHNGFTSTVTPLVDDSIALIEQGQRSGVSRVMASGDNYADAISWMNAIQEECEKSELGIPFLNSTDPYSVLDIPQPVGLAAAMDEDLWRRAGNFFARIWRSTGVRCDLGPQIDVGSNPYWCRYSGSVSEDPALNRDFARAFVGGLQSTWGDNVAATDDQGWGKESVAAMVKHYVGAGAEEGGRNDHNDAGKYDVFPGDNFNAHLIPFLDGACNLDTKTEATAAIMPNYAIAYDYDQKYGENVGGGFSVYRNSILRNAGWDGMITTDWQITYMNPNMGGGRMWGVENLTPAERELKGIKADDDQFGGEFLPEYLTEAYNSYVEEYGEEKALERLQNSARRIFKVMLDVELFDDPFDDRAIAEEIFQDSAFTDFAVEAGEKCIVMLKNKDNIISADGLGDKPKAYIPQVLKGGGMFSTEEARFELGLDEDIANEYFDVVTDTIGEPTGQAAGGFGPNAAPADENADPVYQQSDAQRPSDEELAKCDYAILFVTAPFVDSSLVQDGDTNKCTYFPPNMQFRPYTATGENVATESLAGSDLDTPQGDSVTGSPYDMVNHGTKENRSWYGNTTESGSEDVLDNVIAVKEALGENGKLILVVSQNNAMCYHEIEPYADVILTHYDSVSSKALANILTGQTEPSGLLPNQQPMDMDAVEAQLQDVPRDMECYTDSEGNTYDFAFGLNWSGVIDDDRVATYSADALTEPETEVIPGE